MNYESANFSPENLSVDERIDRLWDIVRTEKSADKNTWLSARLTEIADEIKVEVKNTAPTVSLSGIPEWEKLIGGSEVKDFDTTTRKYVQALLKVKLADIEQQWGIK